MPTLLEEKRVATWGTEIPDDLVLDEKLLAEALKKVTEVLSFVFVIFLLFLIFFFTSTSSLI